MFCKVDSGIEQIVLFDLLLRELLNQEKQGGCKNGFCVSRITAGVQGREALLSRREDDGSNNSSFDFEPRRYIETGLKNTETSKSVNYLSPSVAIRSVFVASKDSANAKRDRLLEKLNCCKMEKNQLKIWNLEKIP